MKRQEELLVSFEVNEALGWRRNGRVSGGVITRIQPGREEVAGWVEASCNGSCPNSPQDGSERVGGRPAFDHSRHSHMGVQPNGKSGAGAFGSKVVKQPGIGGGFKDVEAISSTSNSFPPSMGRRKHKGLKELTPSRRLEVQGWLLKTSSS